MKVYYIDKVGKNLRIKDIIEKSSGITIECKDTYSFRATKNDFVILSEYNEKDPDNILLSKFNNLIILVKNKDKDIIWQLATKLKTIDIISEECEEKYIAERIKKLIL